MGSRERSKAVGVFQMVNLDCSGCAQTVLKSLRKKDGVRSVGINYITDKVYVSYDPERVTPEQIRKTIEKSGYKAFRSSRRVSA